MTTRSPGAGGTTPPVSQPPTQQDRPAPTPEPTPRKPAGLPGRNARFRYQLRPQPGAPGGFSLDILPPKPSAIRFCCGGRRHMGNSVDPTEPPLTTPWPVLLTEPGPPGGVIYDAINHAGYIRQNAVTRFTDKARAENNHTSCPSVRARDDNTNSAETTPTSTAPKTPRYVVYISACVLLLTLFYFFDSITS